MAFRIWTDGSFSPTKKSGAWSYLILDGSNRLIEVGWGREHSGDGFTLTNNRMELLAIINGLNYLSMITQNPGHSVLVYTDSMYAMGPYTEGKAINVNQDLFEILTPLVEKYNVTFRWVKGHGTHKYNNLVDALARCASGTL